MISGIPVVHYWRKRMSHDQWRMICHRVGVNPNGHQPFVSIIENSDLDREMRSLFGIDENGKKKRCDDPDHCTYSDCPTAFCDKHQTENPDMNPKLFTDQNWLRREGFLTRQTLKLLRWPILRLMQHFLNRAFEAGLINSHQLHLLSVAAETMLFPSYSQPTRVVQSGNVVGGDMAGGDINK